MLTDVALDMYRLGDLVKLAVDVDCDVDLEVDLGIDSDVDFELVLYVVLDPSMLSS